MAGNTTNISIRMDADLKAQADALFNELGMNLTTAFNIFVRQSLREGGIPFESQEAKRRLSTWRFSRSARMADKILAITVLHQIIICPPNRGGKISIRPSMRRGSLIAQRISRRLTDMLWAFAHLAYIWFVSCHTL